MKNFVLAVVVLGVMGSSAAWGQSNEGAIRQASQNLFLRGVANQNMEFSVTGQLTDISRVYLPNGQLFSQETLSALRNSPFCYERFQNSGGNWTLRFRFNVSPTLNGGRSELFRPGSGVVDVDPIVLQ